MSGKVLIYGGSGGIGTSIARALHAKGYGLHLVGRDEARLAQVAHETGAGFTVADVEEAEAFARVAQDSGPRLSSLVYAVGTINLKPLSRLSRDDIERDFRINATGAALAVQASLPALKACEGIASVVLFSTVAVRQGFPSHISVSMAKGAVEGLVLALAAEFAPKIRVNAIAPSLTRTPLTERLTSNPVMSAAIAQLHPMQRLGEAHDIAGLAAFLISDEASWITGQIIGADGGRSSLRVKG
jgi:NAD(P)-dependent dehydrogenase (short-subunit alcohol dehydrogenase family)